MHEGSLVRQTPQKRGILVSICCFKSLTGGNEAFVKRITDIEVFRWPGLRKLKYGEIRRTSEAVKQVPPRGCKPQEISRNL
jgi:hypothetical protein